MSQTTLTTIDFVLYAYLQLAEKSEHISHSKDDNLTIDNLSHIKHANATTSMPN